MATGFGHVRQRKKILMKMALGVALWVLVIGAAFWCFLKGGRAGGGGCGGCGGGCNPTDGDGEDDLRAELLEIQDRAQSEDGGSPSRLAQGRVWVRDFVHATFHAHWTPGRSAHPVRIDLVLGDHEDGAAPDRRIGVSVAYRNDDGQGGFTIVDAGDRPFATPEAVGKAMRASEVAGTPLAREVFELATCIVRSLPMFAAIETVD